MADPILKFPPEQKGTPTPRPEARRRAAPPPDGRHAALPPRPVAGGAAAGGAAGGRDVLSQRRPLRDHRRCLCRRAEGADHARRLRQDHQRRREGRPAGLDRRHPVPDRSGAVPAGAGAGARQARGRQDQPRQPRRQRQTLFADDRNRQRRHRDQAARRRAQESRWSRTMSDRSSISTTARPRW